MLMHYANVGGGSAAGNGDGANGVEEWHRARFKVAEGRWVLGSERMALSASPAPSSLPGTSNSQGTKNGASAQRKRSGSDSSETDSTLSPSRGLQSRNRSYYGTGQNTAASSSCKSVVAAYTSMSALTQHIPSATTATSQDANNDSGSAVKFLILGNEIGLGIFDANNIEESPLKYLKTTDLRGFNSSFPTSIAVQTINFIQQRNDNVKSKSLLLGLNTGEVVCLTSLVTDVAASISDRANNNTNNRGTSSSGSTPPSPSILSSSSSPASSPGRGGLIGKAFGAGSSNGGNTNGGNNNNIVIFAPEGVLDEMKCTCLTFIGRKCSSQDEEIKYIEIFAAAYSDGSVIFYDLAKDPKADPMFPDDNSSGTKDNDKSMPANAEKSGGGGTSSDDKSDIVDKGIQRHSSGLPDNSKGNKYEKGMNFDSVYERHSALDGKRSEGMLGGIFMSTFSPDPSITREEHDPIISVSRNVKSAAIQRWKFIPSASKSQQQFSSPYLPTSNSNSINAMEMSPDGVYIATGSRDGLIRILNVTTGKLINGVKSYYGATLCLAWSPDSRYLLSGGEDDRILLFGIREKRIMAFLEGHTSYVSSVSFDAYWSSSIADDEEKGSSYTNRNQTVHPSKSEKMDTASDSQEDKKTATNGDEKEEEVSDIVMRQYRAVSGGQDAKLCFWDLAVEDELNFEQRGTATLTASFSKVDIGSTNIIIESPKRLLTPHIAPAMCHIVHPEPIIKVIIDANEIYSIDQSSRVRMWLRPKTC